MQGMTSADISRALSSRLDGEIATSDGARAMYGADASNYRRIPLAVVFPRHVEDVKTTVSVCADSGTPITMRGGGTSVAGNSVGPGVVIDTSRHMDRILDLDPVSRTARVEAGVVLASLQEAARPHGLRFGPDPSTNSRCTLGGMIGNNACGNHSVAWGTTADNIRRLALLTATGTVLEAGDSTAEEWEAKQDLHGEEGRIYRELLQLENANRGLWRSELSSFSRRVSGYGVDRLLPERGRSLAKALVGTEGTCGIVLEAEVQLVTPPSAHVLCVLGFPDDIAAADAVPTILPHHPLTVEGMDSELVTVARGGIRDGMPEGDAWLFVELGGETLDEAQDRADALLLALGRARTGPSSLIVTEERQRRALWKIRRDGAGLATRDTTTGNEAWPGWEDAAVPPENLGSYLREFRALLRRYDLRGCSYGHFGEGCIHVRVDFDLFTTRGVAEFRSFVEEAADAVVAHGGSLSGEHGDGLARSALLSRMYSAEMMNSFAAFKQIFDPANILNPGIVIDPPQIDEHLRHQAVQPLDLPTPRLRYPEDEGDFARAVRRCVGVGKCRSADGAVMCPSWLATNDEKHSTRGRARLLQELVSGDAVTAGWQSKDALEALDGCLSCKGCSNDCPVGVDMAVYKAEFLYQHYRRRLRPLAHYSMGWLPLMARIATRMPRLVNAVTRSRLQGLLKRAGGIDATRSIPRFAPQSFVASRRSSAQRELAGHGTERGAPDQMRTRSVDTRESPQDVVLLPDTFGNYLAPQVLHAGIRVLEAAGLNVRLPDGGVCCGLTWFSTGQLGTVERVLRRTEKALAAAQGDELPIVVLEPSCATMLRSEARAVLGDTPFTRYLARHVFTLAEALERFAPGWTPPRVDARAVGQVHCHQTSVLGFDADRRLMTRAGIDSSGMQSGCCGLAGNFGFERGHGEISATIAGQRLLPALAAGGLLPGPATPGNSNSESAAAGSAVPLADGFSCRTQMSQLGGVQARHLAEILADQLP